MTKFYVIGLCMNGAAEDRNMTHKFKARFKAAFYPKLEKLVAFKLDGKYVIKESDLPFVEGELAKLCRKYRLKDVSYDITDLQELQRNYEGLIERFGGSCPILSSGINAKLARIKEGFSLICP